jgi:hypothetical protein
MTEAEWLTSSDVVAMLKSAWGKFSGRKYRLYLCGGCQFIRADLYSPNSVEALSIVERWVDGSATDAEVGSANGMAESPTFGFDFDADFWRRHPETDRSSLLELVKRGALSEGALTGGEWRVDEAIRTRLLAAAELAYISTIGYTRGEREPNRLTSFISVVNWPGRWLVDCILGNPFRPITLDPSWRTEAVTALATGIYADRAFDRLPILADALQEAGCEDEDVLAHCRNDGPHARGCWVVDLVLGKA